MKEGETYKEHIFVPWEHLVGGMCNLNLAHAGAHGSYLESDKVIKYNNRASRCPASIMKYNLEGYGCYVRKKVEIFNRGA